MTHEEILRAMQQSMGGFNQQERVDVPVDKLDLFIERCIKELGYTEHSLHQTISWKLYGQPPQHSYIILSAWEEAILPQVLARLEGKI